MELLPNGRDDGGIGLIHMQPSVAVEYGLKTYEGNDKLIDKEYGKRLRELIASKKNDVFVLAREDERFNRLLDIDAAGRMLAQHKSGPVIGEHGPLRTAIMRYAGKHNYEEYYATLRIYMKLLYDESYLAGVGKVFDRNNPDLTINNHRIEEGRPFTAYLKAFWEHNEKSFDLETYRRLPAHRPKHSDAVLATYKKFFLDA